MSELVKYKKKVLRQLCIRVSLEDEKRMKAAKTETELDQICRGIINRAWPEY